jgi:hypothetical protein
VALQAKGLKDIGKLMMQRTVSAARQKICARHQWANTK